LVSIVCDRDFLRRDRVSRKWTKKEAADFDAFLTNHRRIDDELWR